MKTITGREINVKPNYSKRTFTIRTQDFKYRTMQMDKEEFNSALHWTANDWQEFLNRTDEYYLVRTRRRY